MDKETLYARWLNNELSEAEILELKASGEWEILESIVKETDTWRLPKIDQQHYASIQNKIQSIRESGNTKVIPINRWTWAYRAASVAIIFSLVYWFFFRQDIVVYENLDGQVSTVVLPDSTEVQLIGRSRLRFDNKNFARARRLKVEGRAFLAVTKKGPFTAEFNGGEVQVLGTQFEILAGNKMSSVKCYEGRVKVLAEGKLASILNPGDGVRFQYSENVMSAFQFESRSADQLILESVFTDAPLQEVIEAMQIQFGISIDASNIDQTRKYSGKFVHNNLLRSLDMVFVPMGINYRVNESDEKKIILE